MVPVHETSQEPLRDVKDDINSIHSECGALALRWKLDNDMYLVSSCEVQSVLDMNNLRSFLTLNALNEFASKYSGVDWRQKLETQKGVFVLAIELKSNPNKNGLFRLC
ncbi:eukaryotic translation initiation factor 3subunit D [Striga asiatica]|uniref:Eukaryotic translation initiation factor 3subunit D n=1 Tax=Striga asiatica TaxID=4170 RepID=A0A5A7PG04_STRAF|nr:eukaryotic translation initiation factor 3subunit D [Striga asiatica]